MREAVENLAPRARGAGEDAHGGAEASLALARLLTASLESSSCDTHELKLARALMFDVVELLEGALPGGADSVPPQSLLRQIPGGRAD
jgi:hypothetical protein